MKNICNVIETLYNPSKKWDLVDIKTNILSCSRRECLRPVAGSTLS